MELFRALAAAYLIGTLNATALAKLANWRIASTGILRERVVPPRAALAVLITVSAVEFLLATLLMTGTESVATGLRPQHCSSPSPDTGSWSPRGPTASSAPAPGPPASNPPLQQPSPVQPPPAFSRQPSPALWRCSAAAPAEPSPRCSRSPSGPPRSPSSSPGTCNDPGATTPLTGLPPSSPRSATISARPAGRASRGPRRPGLLRLARGLEPAEAALVGHHDMRSPTGQRRSMFSP